MVHCTDNIQNQDNSEVKHTAIMCFHHINLLDGGSYVQQKTTSILGELKKLFDRPLKLYIKQLQMTYVVHD